MLAYVSEQYEESKRRNAEESNQYQRLQNRLALVSAAWQIVRARISEEESQLNAHSAICSVLGHAGGNATHLAWLQPALFHSSSDLPAQP